MSERRGSRWRGRRAEGRRTDPRAGQSRLDQPLVKRSSLVPQTRMDPESFGAFAERFARFMGTARFLVWMTVFVVVWVTWNVVAPDPLVFDPYAFIFLTLMLSLQASYAAPLILLATNRQDDRDRVQMEHDRQRAERNLNDTEYLARELSSVRLTLADVVTNDDLRQAVDRVAEALDDLRDRLEQVAPTAAPSAAAADTDQAGT